MDSWVSIDDVLADEAFCNLTVDEDLEAQALAAAIDATSILYVLSGRTLPGIREVRVWPESTLADGPGAIDASATRIMLEWPVVEVVEVALDGTALELGSDFEIHDYRFLVRLPDAEGRVRTWPRSRVPEDFTITYRFGMEAPAWAADAARELAVALLRRRRHLGSPLPEGATSVSRQGTSFSLAQRADALRAAALRSPDAFPEVTRFIGLVNPGGEVAATFAWSPDLGVDLHRVTQTD